MRAWACGERRNAAWSIPGKVTSSMKRPSPRRNRGSSRRFTAAPKNFAPIPRSSPRLYTRLLRVESLATRGGCMHDVHHVSVSIARRPDEVYAFASDPTNLPRWAADLARSEVGKDGDHWTADAPFGRIKLRFAPQNSFGIMDHDVTLESGVTIHNAMRVVPNGQGSEFVFTLIRQPGMSDAQLAADSAAVERDLKTLKDLLERDQRL